MLPNKKNINAIIFDLGGVILNIDYNRPAEVFAKFGVENFHELYGKAKQNGLFDDFETGKLSIDAFCNGLRKVSGKWLSNEQIITAWNSLLLDLPDERIKLLYRLKQEFPLYLLSNTNQIHVDFFENYIENKYGCFIFKELFINYYYSHQIGLRKPHKACFEYVLNKNRLNPAHTLFIDDSIQHIEGASYCGIRSYLLKEEEDIVSLFENWL